jgi:hypothetical protein
LADALDTGGAIDKLSKEAGILLIMLLAGGVALYFGWDQISSVFEAQQKLERAVEDLYELEVEIEEVRNRIENTEIRLSGFDVDVMLIKRDVNDNNYFRVNWPLGRIGSLPDDTRQNLKIEYIEKRLQKLEEAEDR